MFCPQCGVQPAPQTKFCKACGLKLTEFEALLEDSEQASEAKHHLCDGTGLLLGSLLLTLLAFLVFGIVMFRQPNNPSLEPLWGVFIISALPLLLGFAGLGFLWRGGFFKNFRSRYLQHEIEELEHEIEKKAPPIGSAARTATRCAVPQRRSGEHYRTHNPRVAAAARQFGQNHLVVTKEK
jgi:hypothetical protein